MSRPAALRVRAPASGSARVDVGPLRKRCHLVGFAKSCLPWCAPPGWLSRSDVFERCYARLPRKLPLKFAAPGAERQDSVFNGFQQIDAAAQVGLRRSDACVVLILIGGSDGPLLHLCMLQQRCHGRSGCLPSPTPAEPSL